MSLKLTELTAIVDYANGAKSKIADLTQKLADAEQRVVDAMADDKADKDALDIAVAKANEAQLAADAAKEAVEVAKAANEALQAVINEDMTEELQANAVIDSFVMPS